MNKLPNSFFRLIGGLLILFFINGCATYKLSTLNHDPIYDSAGNSVDISVINNEFELARKFKTDDTFRWNFARYAMNQTKHTSQNTKKIGIICYVFNTFQF